MKVKICGITQLEDAQIAADLGVWALGFVFYEKSPRYICPEAAAKIIDRLPASIRTVGVFVNPTLEHLREVKAISKIQIVQLHGDESPEFCRDLNRDSNKPQIPIFKAVRLKSALDFKSLSLYQGVDALLIDAATGNGQWGGTGVRSDWGLANQMREFWKKDVILAGGLNAENLSEGVRVVKPNAVDVSSGVEDYPGKKSRTKLKEFFMKSGVL